MKLEPFMFLAVKEEKYRAVEVNFKFPFFRLCVLEPNHKIYCKFESVGKISKIEERFSETGLFTLDKQEDFLRDIASVDMLHGTGTWQIIEEDEFDKALFRLIDKISKV